MTSKLGKPLAPREIRAARLYLEGLRTKEIAKKMGITKGAVCRCMFDIREKLGVGGRNSALVALAIREHLEKPQTPHTP